MIIGNPSHLTTTSSVTVTVAQTLTQIAVTPAAASVADSATQAFTATATDQFGQTIASQPAFTWSVDTGGAGGTINASGLYTAPASGSGSDTVRATSGAVSGTVGSDRVGGGLGHRDIPGHRYDDPGQLEWTYGADGFDLSQDPVPITPPSVLRRAQHQRPT